MSRPICLYMPEQGEIGVIMMWFAPKKGERVKWWHEIRGNPIRDNSNPDCLFHRLHDCNRRINLSELHADRVVTICPEFGEVYEDVLFFMQETICVWPKWTAALFPASIECLICGAIGTMYERPCSCYGGPWNPNLEVIQENLRKYCNVIHN